MSVQNDAVEVRSYFVRHRNAMACFGDFERIFEDHYLHLMQLETRLEPANDEMLKDALACLTLTLLSRPQNEAIAWTASFRDPPLNLFVTGDTQLGNVIGRVFTKDVKIPEANIFYSQITRPSSPVRQSTVNVEGREFLSVLEQYYEQSEQFPARLFHQGGDSYAMVVAHPDIDMLWLEGLTEETVKSLHDDETLSLLEKRGYRFSCGCDLGIILNVLVSSFGADPAAIFAGDPHVEVHCPRCGGSFTIKPSMVEEYIAAKKADEKAKDDG